MLVVIVFIFSNTIVYLEFEPVYERPKYRDPVVKKPTFFEDDEPQIPTDILINISEKPLPSNLIDSEKLDKEYIDKWYGDEIGFNESLILSCERLTYGGNKASAAFSPDGKKIIFPSKMDGGDYFDIGIMDIDRTNYTQLTFEDIFQSQPSFLSDGNHFIYVTREGPGMTLWVKSLIDNSTWHADVDVMYPSPAPDNKIIFVSNCTVIVDMYFQNFTYLTDGMGGHWPHIDANGTKIASEKYHAYNHTQLLLYDLETNTTTQLTNSDIDHNDPAISPDGKMIVYSTHCSLRGSDWSNLWLYDIDTGEHMQLTEGPVTDAMAEFSPDGKHIVFGSTRGNEGWSFDLWLITLEEGYW
jgi:Tol biopolymer transport system component